MRDEAMREPEGGGEDVLLPSVRAEALLAGEPEPELRAL